jgi:hypothetical protein
MKIKQSDVLDLFQALHKFDGDQLEKIKLGHKTVYALAKNLRVVKTAVKDWNVQMKRINAANPDKAAANEEAEKASEHEIDLPLIAIKISDLDPEKNAEINPVLIERLSSILTDWETYGP